MEILTQVLKASLPLNKKNIQYLRDFSFSLSLLVALKIKDPHASNILDFLMYLSFTFKTD